MAINVPTNFPYRPGLGAVKVATGKPIRATDIQGLAVDEATWCYAAGQRRRAFSYAPYGAQARGPATQTDNTSLVTMCRGIFSFQAGLKGRKRAQFMLD